MTESTGGERRGRVCRRWSRTASTRRASREATPPPARRPRSRSRSRPRSRSRSRSARRRISLRRFPPSPAGATSPTRRSARSAWRARERRPSRTTSASRGRSKCPRLVLGNMGRDLVWQLDAQQPQADWWIGRSPRNIIWIGQSTCRLVIVGHKIASPDPYPLYPRAGLPVSNSSFWQIC